MRAFGNRAVATAVAIALTATSAPAFAANADKSPQIKQATATDFSAAKKKRYYRHRGLDPAGRAFLGIAGAMFGAAAAGIAADHYRERHRYYAPYGYGYPYGGYGYPYGGYAPGPYYYGAYPY
jgi:hypothetical protein